jgi:DNA transformation protein and related proteins
MDDAAIHDLFLAFGPVRLKKMFGGRSIYSGEAIIAIEFYGEIFIKADAQSAPLFYDAGSTPFTYQHKDGKTSSMAYWRLPETALDDPAELKSWARLGEEASRRTVPKKKKKAKA